MLTHRNRSLAYDHRFLPFVIVEAWECNERVSDSEEDIMVNNNGSYGSSMHGPT